MGFSCYHIFSKKDKDEEDSAIQNSSTHENNNPENQVAKFDDETEVPYIEARFTRFDLLISYKELKSNLYQKYICIKGNVIRVGAIKPKCYKLAFECFKCKTIQARVLTDGKLSYPNHCNADACNSRSFSPLLDSSFNQFINSQTIKLQELNEEDSLKENKTEVEREVGRIPRSIECLLYRDLIDICLPGDQITLSGIVKASQSDGKKEKCMFSLYIEANSIRNLNWNEENDIFQQTLISDRLDPFYEQKLEFSLKDLYAIKKIQANPNTFNLLRDSLCPTIYGHKIVKSALLLALFGGVEKYACNMKQLSIRSEIHILLVGDPGIGKSQMLKAITNLAPNGIYVCGNSTTQAGLTITLTKDGNSGDYSIEAGALILSDNGGVCCIDELDKMPNAQRLSLLECMEQQSVSLAKAGINCTLPSRGSIISAANPHGSGHYDNSKSIGENLKMSASLLSRFDLIFVMTDRANQEMDAMLSEHVIALHSEFSHKNLIQSAKNHGDLQIKTTSYFSNDLEPNVTINDKNIAQFRESYIVKKKSLLPTVLLKKYLKYAKTYVTNVELMPGAKSLIREFYLELRTKSCDMLGIPITIRQLESLIRLTEARAKLDLRGKADEKDAIDIINIMKHSMWGANRPMTVMENKVEFYNSITNINNSCGKSYKAQPKKFIEILRELSKQRQDGDIYSTRELLQIIKDYHIRSKNPLDFIQSLNFQGFLVDRGSSNYKLTKVEFNG
ncbi:DNA helicase MCM8-like isoform X2 [Gordionus sp. m RMFG-2023]|uniref:DNA helicase MCM8-like isoform X2 n=1 Tax=Gordionus sp. m RMFG-2023 TaxID=3053472 RepID=UPI0031FD1E00